MIHVRLIDDAFGELLSAAMQCVFRFESGIGEVCEPSADGALGAANGIGDFGLRLAGVVQPKDEADFSSAEP